MDEEKVIKGLRICLMQKDCVGCPYQKELKEILDKSHNDDLHCPIAQFLMMTLPCWEEHPQIVRCKECRWGDPVKNGYGEDVIECTEDMEHRCHATDWFCADGERR